MDATPIEQSLVETIAKSDLSSLAVDWAELGLDSLLDEGLAKDIPVVGSFVKIFGAARLVHNQLFLKKLLVFLSGLDDVPMDQRRKQIEKMASDPKERQRVGENLMLLLDRLNDMAKPTMLANAFRAYLEEDITRDQLQALSHTIDAINIASIPMLRSLYERPQYSPIMDPDPHCQHLAMCGLLSMVFLKVDTTARYGPVPDAEKPAGGLKTNNLGELFCRVVLKVGAGERRKQ